MINSVSNINFKGFYSKKNERYTDSQNRCIDNIKKESTFKTPNKFSICKIFGI